MKNFFPRLPKIMVSLLVVMIFMQTNTQKSYSATNPDLTPPNVYNVTGGGSDCSNSGAPVGLSSSQTGVHYIMYRNGAPFRLTNGTGNPLNFGNMHGYVGFPAPTVSGSFCTYYVRAHHIGQTDTVYMNGSVVVTFYIRPVITFNPISDICYNSAPVPLSATPPGGIFIGDYVIGDQTSGYQFDPSLSGPGSTSNIMYTYSDPVGGCIASPVTQYVTVIGPVWTGLENTNWNNPLNWNCQTVPLATDDVLIPVGCPHYPVLVPGTTISCNNLEVDGSGLKASPLNGGITISGVLIVNGYLYIATSGMVDLSAGGALTIEGDLYIDGNLTVESQGSLITDGTVTGTATIEREIDANLKWHLLSSPVGSQSICNGVFAPLVSGFPGPLAWDFYQSRCAYPGNENWINLRTTTGGVNYADFGTPPSFVVTKGYLVSYGSGWPTTHSFIGIPNTGDQVAPLGNTLTYCSYQLLGNPFPSALSWEPLDKSNLLNDYYWVWNENKTGGPGYEFWSPGGDQSSTAVNGHIPSMQGFFVCAHPDMPTPLSLTLLNSARTHDAIPWLKEAPANKLSITLGNGTNFDEAFIRFGNNYSAGKDREDANKLFSMNTEVPQVYTIVDNDLKTCMNAMPYVTNGTTIPVGFVAPADGNYSITIGGIETFSSLTGLSLEDLKLNYTQNLLQNPVYNFSATGNEDASRFLLHFAGAIGIGEKSNSTISIYSNEKTVFITCAAGFKNAHVTICNLLGQEILSQKLIDQAMNQVNVAALKGYYIIKVQTEYSVKTAKVYIN